VRYEIHKIEEEIISTSSELDLWLEKIYALFREVAVDRKSINTEIKIMSPGVGKANRRDRRSDGMISETSERIYRQRWSNWCMENIETLLSFVNADDSDPKVIRMKAPSQKPFRALDRYMHVMSQESPKPRTLSTQKLTLTLTSNTNEVLTATRTWLGVDAALSEVAEWLKLLPLMWGDDSAQFSTTYRFENEQGESEIVLPVMSLESATSRLPALIETYK
jgi:hypothetical protein